MRKFLNLLKTAQLALLISLILTCMGMTAKQIPDTRGGIGLLVIFGLMWILEGIKYIIWERRTKNVRNHKYYRGRNTGYKSR